nr:uncharacterized protein LOC110073613 [Pogona vitticeps]
MVMLNALSVLSRKACKPAGQVAAAAGQLREVPPAAAFPPPPRVSFRSCCFHRSRQAALRSLRRCAWIDLVSLASESRSHPASTYPTANTQHTYIHTRTRSLSAKLGILSKCPPPLAEGKRGYPAWGASAASFLLAAFLPFLLSSLQAGGFSQARLGRAGERLACGGVCSLVTNHLRTVASNPGRLSCCRFQFPAALAWVRAAVRRGAAWEGGPVGAREQQL